MRLSQGDYDRETVYGDDPVAVAAGVRRRRRAAGSTSSTSTPPAPASRSTGRSSPPSPPRSPACRVQTGGGVRDDGRGRGAGRRRRGPGRDGHRGAASDPTLVRRARGRACRWRSGSTHRGGEVAVRGWTRGQRVATCSTCRRGSPTPASAAFVVTEIGRDGMLGGPDLDGLRRGCSAPPTIAGHRLGRRRHARRPAGARRARGRRPPPGRRHHRQGAVRGPLHRGRGAAALGCGVAPMRVARVIPCLDVDRRPGRQGRQLRRPARRRRPGRAGRPLRRRGRRRAGVPRHHRVVATTATRWSTWCAARPSRCSSRSPSAAASAPSTTPGGCCGPAPTRSASTPPPSSGPS